LAARDRDDRLARAVDRVGAEELGDRELRAALIAEIRRVVPFEWFAWPVTDPLTEVGTAPLADAPVLRDVPGLIRAKYLTDVNRWTSMSDAVTTLVGACDGQLDRSLLWREWLSRYGVSDVASLVFRDPRGCWAWLDVWRVGGEPFTDGEVSVLRSAVAPIAGALKAAQARTFAHVPPKISGGPAVLMLSPELDVIAQTPDTEGYLRSLIPPDGDMRPIPAGAYHVVAQVLAIEAGIDARPASARVHLRDGIWVTFRAARATGEESIDEHIAVTIEVCTPSERRDVFARCHNLTSRESEVLDHLSIGSDTKAIAQSLHVSEHTVQDHLKSMFAKTGTNSRPTLVAHSSGA
jgi:DNA-binding CsgD family transcriptional regulator